MTRAHPHDAIAEARDALSRPSALTERRREILHWLALGKSDDEIGAILGIGERTVREHLDALAKHYGVHGTNKRLRIVVQAIADGDLVVPTKARA